LFLEYYRQTSTESLMLRDRVKHIQIDQRVSEGQQAIVLRD